MKLTLNWKLSGLDMKLIKLLDITADDLCNPDSNLQDIVDLINSSASRKFENVYRNENTCCLPRVGFSLGQQV